MKHVLTFLFAVALLAPVRMPLVNAQNLASEAEGGKVALPAILQKFNSAKGDAIMDFSHAGYGGGGVKLPEAAVKREVAPSGGDDSAAIQAALDAVGALPLVNGLRGAVLLKPGVFRCSQTLTLARDGVVLRGSGTEANGSVIEMQGAAHTAVAFEGERIGFPKETPAALHPIADAYVPTGAVSLSVKDPIGLAVGDSVRIRRFATAAWIRFMGMDTLVRNGKTQTWIKEAAPLSFERTIRAIEGNRLTFDVPLTDAIDMQLQSPGSAVVVKTTAPQRLRQCGLEGLRIHSAPPTGTLTAPNNVAVTMDNCEDCWVKDIAMHDTLSNVQVGGSARRITVRNAQAVHTATVEKGAGYPADFSLRGSQILLDRCTSRGSGSFYVATLNAEATLNVALNCTFEGSGSIQPHMRWSTGLLIDSCRLPDGRIEFINRNTSGSGHGWAIGWAVAWNCVAKSYTMQQPPGAVNWCIGCTGEFKKGTPDKGAWLASFGKPVAPSSLYLAQLRARLGPQALTNIGY